MNTTAVLTAMLPEHLLLVGLVLVIGLEIVGHSRRAALAVAFVAVAAAAYAAAQLSLDGYAAAPFAGQFSVDRTTLLVKAMVLAFALPVLVMARDDFSGGEFPALLLSSLYGVCLLQSADSFATVFLGLELMSLPVYVLVLLAWRRPQSAEAALKYLVLGGTATAMFLMGASLLYGGSATLSIDAFPRALAAGDGLSRAAVVLVVLAFFLKAAIVPFHAWAPDAYEAASVPVTAYMATIVKAGVVLAALRLFGRAQLAAPMLGLVAALPLASIVWGNLAAMRQPSLRRMIAYSSIAHAGYLFYALLGDPAGRLQAIAFYLLAYGLMNLLAFAALPAADDDVARDRLDNLRGLFHRAPFAALMLGLAMLSLAGIPPLPGFVAKFLIFRNVMTSGHAVLAVLGLVGSYLGIYFYLRVIQLMFMSPDANVAPSTGRHRLALGASVACVAAALLVAVFPGWVIGRL
ncbi:MAG TPA: NADH-quinone oxidoreductase subunit N [Caldimonas sp.]|jgi:NADH-quinone oxidoreductase subunit N|nr:NADH-quinone oxidoreductase subunit N [Caldimonas sp.]